MFIVCHCTFRVQVYVWLPLWLCVIDYDDGYDDDDDYGSYSSGNSYNDSYCVSPGTAAQFTFNRDGRGNSSFADYLSREDEHKIPEGSEEGLEEGAGVDEYEDDLDSSANYHKPQLTDEQEGMEPELLIVLTERIYKTHRGLLQLRNTY